MNYFMAFEPTNEYVDDSRLAQVSEDPIDGDVLDEEDDDEDEDEDLDEDATEEEIERMESEGDPIVDPADELDEDEDDEIDEDEDAELVEDDEPETITR